MLPLDVPIIHRSYELYRAVHQAQKSISRMERYTLWQRCENMTLDLLEGLLEAGYLPPDARVARLVRVSARLDMLRLFLRLAFDIKAINQKSYLALQEMLDETGRMLGGWLKSLRKT